METVTEKIARDPVVSEQEPCPPSRDNSTDAGTQTRFNGNQTLSQRQQEKIDWDLSMTQNSAIRIEQQEQDFINETSANF